MGGTVSSRVGVYDHGRLITDGGRERKVDGRIGVLWDTPCGGGTVAADCLDGVRITGGATGGHNVWHDHLIKPVLIRGGTRNEFPLQHYPHFCVRNRRPVAGDVSGEQVVVFSKGDA